MYNSAKKQKSVILGSPLGPPRGDNEPTFLVLFQLWGPKAAKRHPGVPQEAPGTAPGLDFPGSLMDLS